MVGEICWSLVTLFRVKKFYVQTLSVADLHCNSYIVTLSNFLHSHAVFGIIWQNNRLALAPPGRNAGSAAVCIIFIHNYIE